MYTFCSKNLLWLGVLFVVVVATVCFLRLRDVGGVVARKPADFVMPVEEKVVIVGSDKGRAVIKESSLSSTSVSTPTALTISVPPKAEVSIQAAPLYKVDPGFGGGIPPKLEAAGAEGAGVKFCDEL